MLSKAQWTSPGPSARSIREIPEVGATARARPNPWARRILAQGVTFNGRGRPRNGEGTGPTIPRSVRLPPAFWKRVEAKARAQGLTLHAALRLAIARWVVSRR